MYNNLHKYKSLILFVVKLLIIGGAYYFISHKISNNTIFTNSASLNLFKETIFNRPWVLFSLFTFSIMNWILEISKWQNLVSSFKNISFFEASKQSLASLTASLLTPNRVGEYGAKAIYYNKKERYTILFLNFLGNISQMGFTTLFGGFGLLFLSKKLGLINNFPWFEIMIFTGFLFILYQGVPKKLRLAYWRKINDKFKEINVGIHLKNLGFSLWRYLIFSHQFYFLLVIFDISLDYPIAISIICSVYFIASVIPGFMVFDWLIKGSVAVSLFSPFEVPEIIVLSITSILWILNFALPSIIGSYFVLTFNKPSLVTTLKT